MPTIRRRGRPRLDRPARDLGTQELQAKRLLDLTIESLDLCLKRRLITISQHESGMRLRWLYTIHFGLPNVSAYDPDKHNSRPIHLSNEKWMAERKEEYAKCMEYLGIIKAKRITLNVCVFNQRPEFLLPFQRNIDARTAKIRNSQLIKLREGLDMLDKIFCNGL